MYAYNIDIANNIAGAEEDEINKPDRPIVSKKMTLAGAKIRYCVETAMYLTYSYFLNVHIWAFVWILTVFSAYFLHLAKIGPGKDLYITIGTVAQLMASWKLGGSGAGIIWSWVEMLGYWTFFTIPLQDLRDVPGDLAACRRTTPILLGDILGMFGFSPAKLSF